jgi:hypothetical protein
MSKPPISKYDLTMIQASKGHLHSRIRGFYPSPSLYGGFLSFLFSLAFSEPSDSSRSLSFSSVLRYLTQFPDSFT